MGLSNFSIFINTGGMRKVAGFFNSLLLIISLFVPITTISVMTELVVAPSALAGTTYCSNIGSSTNCSGSGGSTYCSNIGSSTNCSGPGGSTYCSSIGSSLDCSGPGGSTYCSSIGSSLDCSGPGGSTYCSSVGSSTNCSGSGVGIIPLPQPTPTKSFQYSYPIPKPTLAYSYKSPTPTHSTVGSTGSRTCISSKGLTTSCGTFPNFEITYCSALSGGTLEQKNGISWIKLWTITSVKDSAQCSDPAYSNFVDVSGRLGSKQNITLRIVHKSVIGMDSSPDYFAVVTK